MESASTVTEQPVMGRKTHFDPVPPLLTNGTDDCCLCAWCFGPRPQQDKSDVYRRRRSSLWTSSTANDVDDCNKRDQDYLHIENSFSLTNLRGHSGEKSKGSEDGINPEILNTNNGDTISHHHVRDGGGGGGCDSGGGGHSGGGDSGGCDSGGGGGCDSGGGD